MTGFFGGTMDVSTLFQNVGSDTKGQFTSPTASSTEWYQWLSWANEELYAYGEVHDWPELGRPDPVCIQIPQQQDSYAG